MVVDTSAGLYTTGFYSRILIVLEFFGATEGDLLSAGMSKL